MTSHDFRWWSRRRVYLGEGLTFELLSGADRLHAEAIDLTPDGLGLAIVDPLAAMPAVGDLVTARYTGRGASGAVHVAVVRHVGTLRTAQRALPRLGLSLVPGTTTPSFACPAALPAFATAACPWFFGETLRFQVLAVGPDGMTIRTAAPLLPGAELDFELHLPLVGVQPARGRLASVRRDEVGVAWIEPSPELLTALAQYVLAGDETLTPAALRAGDLALRSIERAVTYDYATTKADFEEVLALRLLAHQAEGHLEGATIEDMRSPFDAHSRHLTCRFGERIVGYCRVIYVDGDPARSQYVALGGHEVPQWLWDAGFVEGGAGATHPDFQRAGLYVGLMQHMFRVAVQSGHRHVLGACPDELVPMYRDMGFELLEERIVNPKPGWSFRSHLIYADAERLLREPAGSRSLAAMASAISFAEAA
jgi:N-acyl amino acid synthase FeeM